jgi:hypothetical protein
VLTAAQIVARMHDAVPAGRESLDGPALSRLTDLTEDLLARRPEAVQEYWRFLGIRAQRRPGRVAAR